MWVCFFLSVVVVSAVLRSVFFDICCCHSQYGSISLSPFPSSFSYTYIPHVISAHDTYPIVCHIPIDADSSKPYFLFSPADKLPFWIWHFWVCNRETRRCIYRRRPFLQCAKHGTHPIVSLIPIDGCFIISPSAEHALFWIWRTLCVCSRETHRCI